MIPLAICLTIISLLISIAVFFVYISGDSRGSAKMIGGGIAAGVVLLSSIGVGTATTAIASKASIQNQLTFNEMWNGFETRAGMKNVACIRDGSCRHTYQCDPYPKQVMKTRTVTNSKGEVLTDYYWVTEIHYHSCPYSKQETSYWVETNLKGLQINYGSSLMTGEPFRARTNIPGGQKTTPILWLKAKKRIDSGKPEGVTKSSTYTNYILASGDNLYKRDDSMIESLVSKNILPKFSTSIDSGLSKKFYNASGIKLPNTYPTDVSNLNGALAASKKHGDLRVVAVDSSRIQQEVGNQHDYVNALASYWSDTKVFGKWALPKNSVVVIIGINKETSIVDWTEAFTGMPVGNEHFIQAVKSEMKGAKVDSELLGRPYINSTGEVVRSSGKLESVLWGSTNGFQRVSMSGDGDLTAGFLYLGSSVQPSKSAVVTVGVIWGALALLLGFIMASTARNSFKEFGEKFSK